MKYRVTSGHAEDVGLGRMLEPGEEFDDKEVLDAVKERLKGMEESGQITQSTKEASS